MTKDEVAAAYLIDRADQYVTESACWVALVDAAKCILVGEHTKSYREGEFDDDMVARVRKIKRTQVVASSPPRVHATSGVDPDDFVDDEDDDE